MNKRKFRASLVRIAEYVVLAYSFLASLIILLIHWPMICRAKTVVFWAEGGFGHTITGVDLVRRLYQDGPIVVFFAFSHGRHNPKVTAIWNDIQLVWLPLSAVLGNRAVYPPLSWCLQLYTNLKELVSQLLPNKRVVLSSDCLDFLNTQIGLYISPHDWYCTYFELIQKTAYLPPPRLRDQYTRPIDVLVRQRIGSADARKVCTLYLRNKSDGGALISSTRNGSTPDSWTPAVDRLIARGYRILLVGDRDIPSDWHDRFGPSILDYSSLGTDKDAFSLYAASLCDIFVGECGGGIWQAILSAKPCLIVNVFPIRAAFPNSTVQYKSVIEQSTGRILTLLEMSEKFPEADDRLSGQNYRLVDNSSEELVAAVDDFLAHQSINDYRPPQELLPHLAPNNWLRFTNCRISQPWLEAH